MEENLYMKIGKDMPNCCHKKIHSKEVKRLKIQELPVTCLIDYHSY